MEDVFAVAQQTLKLGRSERPCRGSKIYTSMTLDNVLKVEGYRVHVEEREVETVYPGDWERGRGAGCEFEHRIPEAQV